MGTWNIKVMTSTGVLVQALKRGERGAGARGLMGKGPVSVTVTKWEKTRWRLLVRQGAHWVGS
jgi:hypothetical protein